MAMSAMHGLIEGAKKHLDTGNKEHVMDLDAIAKYYGMWLDSGPDCVGPTTKKALGGLKLNPFAKVAYDGAN